MVKKKGVFRNYNAKGTITSVQEFRNDIPDGIFLKFGDGGGLELEENYKEGVLHGKRVQYRFGEIKRSSDFFVNGKLDGLKTVYYDNGFRQEEAQL
jgi:antitoxin component YwqK of YwqJK toxin-antitoxin module